MPLHEARILWRVVQGREQVRREQRGQVYLGGWVWQMLQRVLRRGSDIVRTVYGGV